MREPQVACNMFGENAGRTTKVRGGKGRRKQREVREVRTGFANNKKRAKKKESLVQQKHLFTNYGKSKRTQIT